VEAALRGLLASDRSARTAAGYAESLVAFCAWCVQRGYLAHNPLKGLKRIHLGAHTVRRALTQVEIAKLLEAASADRQLLYETALTTGLRAKELRSLRVCDLDPTRGGLILDPEWTKNRLPGFQVLPASLLKKLTEASRDKGPHAPLLKVPMHTSRIVDRDLEKAGIPKTTSEGKVDFHALRTTYATLIIESGANVKETQVLLRHASPNVTMNAYARTRPEGLQRVADHVGEMINLRSKCATSVQRASGVETEGTPNPLSLSELQPKANAKDCWFKSSRPDHLRF
jgi:integrase